ncbi:hypothetical protein RR42_m3369 [Cupriavidus basilensis]|uniref:Uncharacterized protein n=1 Tax=Cupriavidus basilensis TaxID=68895 RepID=A0A0C4Y5R5_9BURK|nr:hypothetical protein RR42_m3369 [Cupriavidus basilensis]
MATQAPIAKRERNAPDGRLRSPAIRRAASAGWTAGSSAPTGR